MIPLNESSSIRPQYHKWVFISFHLTSLMFHYMLLSAFCSSRNWMTEGGNGFFVNCMTSDGNMTIAVWKHLRHSIICCCSGVRHRHSPEIFPHNPCRPCPADTLTGGWQNAKEACPAILPGTTGEVSGLCVLTLWAIIQEITKHSCPFTRCVCVLCPA